MNPPLFIINPISARRKTSRTWEEVEREISRIGFKFVTYFTAGPGDATRAAREAIRSGVTCVVAVGGDGTFGEVVNGYFDGAGRPINRDAAVGLMPSGTGSDFRRTVGLASWRDSLRALTGSRVRVIDAARATFIDTTGEERSRIFINMASFGLGGDVSALVNRWRGSLPAWVSGRARFVAAALRALEHYKNRAVSVRLDDERRFEVSSNLIVVANGKYGGGGMKLAPHAEPDDGVLDVILTDRATRLDVVRELPRIQRGGYLKNPKVAELRARKVSIAAAEPMAIDIDGEMAGHTPAEIEVLPSAVKFIA